MKNHAHDNINIFAQHNICAFFDIASQDQWREERFFDEAFRVCKIPHTFTDM